MQCCNTKIYKVKKKSGKLAERDLYLFSFMNYINGM
jgi:hypothetical protein